MKIKNLTVGLLMVGLAFSFAGCGDKEINDSGEKVQSFGQFIEIKEIQTISSNGFSQYSQYFVYDKTTKIVYVVQGSVRSCDSGITPYYVLDENGKPEIAIYGENYNG